VMLPLEPQVEVMEVIKEEILGPNPEEAFESEKGIFNCLKCGKGYTTKYVLDVHMRWHDNGRLFQCTECEKSYKSKSGLREHFVMCHEDGNQFHCNICNKSFKFKRSIKRHKKICKNMQNNPLSDVENGKQLHDNDHPFQCADCEKRYKSASGLTEHFILCHREGNAFPCKQCHKIFGRKDKLEKHLRVHNQRGHLRAPLNVHKEERPLQCNVCGKRFKFKRSLKKHKEECKHIQNLGGCRKGQIIKVSEELEVKPLSDVENRNQWHDKTQLFQCTECGKRYTSKSMKIHLQWHDNGQLFQCAECNKRYKSKSGLSEHFIISHEEGNPFQCNQCQKKFGRKDKLEEHLRVHNNERPYLCKECGLSFKQKSYYSAHLKEHKEGTPLHCNICNKKFKFKRSMEKHNEVYRNIQKHTDYKNYRNKQIIKISEELEVNPLFNVENRKQLNNSTPNEEGNPRNTEIMMMEDLCNEEIKRFNSQEDPRRNYSEETSVGSVTEHTLKKTEEIVYNTSPKSGYKSYNHKNMKNIVETKDDLEHSKINVDADIFTTEKLPSSDHQADELEADKHFEDLSNMEKIADKAKEKMKHLNIKINAKIYMADEISGTKHALKETEEHNYEEIEYNTFPKSVLKSKSHERTLTNIKSRVETKKSVEKVNQVFTQKGHLKKHYFIHKDNERPFQCTECEKSYKFIKDMKEHFIVKHKKVNPFQCHQCHKQFGYKHKLEDHMRVHNNERPFVCNKCERSFKLQGHLTEHLNVHNEGKPFQCNICYTRFKFKRSIKRHKEKCRQMQNNDTPNEDGNFGNAEMKMMAELFEQEIMQLNSPESALEKSEKHNTDENKHNTFSKVGVKSTNQDILHMNHESRIETEDAKVDSNQKNGANIFRTQELPNSNDIEADERTKELTSMVEFAEKATKRVKHLNIKIAPKIYLEDQMTVTTENEYNVTLLQIKQRD